MPAPIAIRVTSNVDALRRELDAFARRQLPFATARALTAVAREAVPAERSAMQAQLDKPTPFTLRGVAAIPATKATQTAIVLIKDVQAAYLEPVIQGGLQVLGKKKGVLKPKDIAVNAYGNIPRGKLKALKGRADIFVGTIHFKDGQSIGGVWQRLPRGMRRDGTMGTKGKMGKAGAVQTGLRLLIRFSDPSDIAPRYQWGAATRRVVATRFGPLLAAALAAALATGRR